MQNLFDAPAPRYISHRGFQPMAPANSLPSFRYAGALRQWAIETDVHRTRDDVLVCCHNDTVDATYNGTGAIREMTWAELRALSMNVGNRLDCLTDEEKRMPLFSEYLAICKKYHSVPFLELKTPDAGRVIEEVRRAGFEQEEIVISSSKLDWLIESRRLAPKAFVHWIFAKEERLSELAALGNAGLSWNIPDWSSRPVEKIALAHEAGLKVCLRAGDSVEAVQTMMEMGLDYIPTNCMHTELL